MSSVVRGAVATTPIWAARSAATTPRYNKLVGAGGRYDVAVVGAGMFGVTSALLLKLQGKKVALIEGSSVGQVCTAASSTAKATSQQKIIYSTLRKMHGIEAARLYGTMQEEAMNELEAIVRRFDVNCDLRRVAHYTWTSEQKRVDEIKEEYEAAIECGLPAELIQGSPEDLPASIEAKAAVRFRDQIAYNPYDYCRSLLSRIEGDGSKVFEHSRVTAVSESSIHEITTAEGSIQADHVILATHLPIMDRSGHFALLPASRSHCIAVTLRQPVLKEMCMSADTPMRSLRVADREGKTLVVAGESIDIGDESDTLKLYKNLEDWARQHFPVESVDLKWSAMDYMSGDKLPYMGRMISNCETIYTATGFSKWGLANGVAGAMLCRDLITGKDNKYAKLVDARRWTIKAAPGFIQENIHTCKHFVSDYVKSLVAPNIDTLKPGEGGLVKAPGHTLAVGAYRDENSNYHIVKPICTHLGCHLVWNNGDRVWDCPCHGSVFNVDGEVVHGPACVNLKTCKDLEQLKNLQW